MKTPYSEEQRAGLNEREEIYRRIMNGVCMTQVGGDSPAEACEGQIGYRHAISERHLRLIADTEKKIRANKEIGSFAVWAEQYDELQRVPVSRFSAGKWACQRHDARFPGIDAKQIYLSNPENLFKAVYRVVVRHNHLTLARWTAHCAGIETEQGWRLFKELAFEKPVSDEEAEEAHREWRNKAHAVMWKMRELERRLAKKEWNSLECRTLLLKSKPTVAGWGCLAMKLNSSEYRDYVDLGYMIVIPQEDGHAIITACTACESAKRFRLPDIVKIHDGMPECVDPNAPYEAEEGLRRHISRRIWGLNELGMRESLYQAWPKAEQDKAQRWMKERGWSGPMHPDRVPLHLPPFF